MQRCIFSLANVFLLKNRIVFDVWFEISVLNLSCQQIKAFVDGHNSRRQQLAKGEIEGQPAASEMKFMVSVTNFFSC